MTRHCWMRGCMADWTLTLPVRSSGRALASGDHCGMCGLGECLKTNCGGHLSAWTGAAAHRPWLICVCPTPRVRQRGAIWLLDEFYVAASTAGGQRDWTRGTYLSNAEQAAGIIEWLSRWNLKPGTTRVVADDAVFNATGSDRGSTAGDFKAAGCPLVRAGKMNQREANGLALVRTMLQAAGRDP